MGRKRGREKEGKEGFGGMWERQRKGSTQEGFQLRSLHSDLIWPVCLGYTQCFHTPPTHSDLQQSPLLCPLYSSNRQRNQVMSCLLLALFINACTYIKIYINLHMQTHTQALRRAKILDRKDKHLATYAPFTVVCLSDRGGNRDRQSECEKREFKSSDIIRPSKISWPALWINWCTRQTNCHVYLIWSKHLPKINQ